MVTKVYCKPFNDIEMEFRLFFYEIGLQAYDAIVYIISPWISNFEFSRPLKYPPLFYAKNILDVIRQLARAGVRFKIVTRCISEKLRDLLLLSLSDIYENDLKCKIIKELFEEEIKRIIRSAELLSLLEKNQSPLQKIEIKFDARKYDADARTLGNLHAKLYVSPSRALIGSANLTASGVTSAGYWCNNECIISIRPEDGSLYTELRKTAEKIYSIALSQDQCLAEVSQTLGKTGIYEGKLKSFDTLVQLFRTFKRRLELCR